jgi:hypothetical protein
MADETTPPGKSAAARKTTQERFAATARRDTEVRKELDRQQAATAAKIVKLRLLRLAKEEADRLAAPSPRPARSRKKKQ